MNTADAHFAGAPCASAIRTMPATIATGKVPAWIQPRQVGLISTCGIDRRCLEEGQLGHVGALGRGVRPLARLTRAPGHAPSLGVTVCRGVARSDRAVPAVA